MPKQRQHGSESRNLSSQRMAQRKFMIGQNLDATIVQRIRAAWLLVIDVSCGKMTKPIVVSEKDSRRRARSRFSLDDRKT